MLAPGACRVTMMFLPLAGLLLMPVQSSSARHDGPQTVKVAAIQCSSDLGQVVANRKKLTSLVREAGAGGAKIVVLPETAITGYVSQDMKTNWHVKGRPIEPEFRGRDPLPFAETVPGESTRHFCALAKELEIYLTIPLLERVGETPPTPAGDDAPLPPGVKPPKFFNTVCLANPEGKLVAHYRKLNPWPYPEKSWATPGDRGLATFETEYGRVGLAICFDIHTILDRYDSEKLWALLYPIAWVDEEHPAEWFWHRLPAEVAKHKHYVVGANWSVDRPEAWRGYGFSTILGPDGAVVATATSLHGSEIIYAELTVAR